MTTATAQLTVTAEPGSHAIVTEREVAAPRDLVFRCYTEPDLISKWMAPRKYEIRIDAFDLRHGGAWRYVNIDRSSRVEFAFRGVFHGEANPDRFIQTFEFEGAPGHVSLETLELVDLGANRTLIRTTSVHQSVQARDAMVESGMAEGMADGYTRLDELVTTLTA